MRDIIIYLTPFIRAKNMINPKDRFGCQLSPPKKKNFLKIIKLLKKDYKIIKRGDFLDVVSGDATEIFEHISEHRRIAITFIVCEAVS